MFSNTWNGFQHPHINSKVITRMSMHLKKKKVTAMWSSLCKSLSGREKIFCWNIKQVIKHHLCLIFTMVLICHYKTIQLGQQKGRIYFEELFMPKLTASFWLIFFPNCYVWFLWIAQHILFLFEMGAMGKLLWFPRKLELG